MKIPRDISGSELIRLLAKYEYVVTRQVGSHIRLTTNRNGTHHITLPNHNPIRIGTLNSILQSISLHLNKTKSEIIDELFTYNE